MTFFLRSREARIAIAASLVYVVIGFGAMLAPGAVPLSDFWAWFCRFMPIPLLLMFVSIGGFKRDFRSNLFDTAMIVLTALVPVIVAIPGALRA